MKLDRKSIDSPALTEQINKATGLKLQAGDIVAYPEHLEINAPDDKRAKIAAVLTAHAPPPPAPAYDPAADLERVRARAETDPDFAALARLAGVRL